MKQKLLTLFTLLVVGATGAWATDIEIPITNLKNFPLDYGLVTITNTANTTISSNELQVKNKTATFQVSTKVSGVYLKTISFTDNNSSKNGGFTCTDNAEYMSGPTENVYTYTAPNTTTAAANFQLIGSGGTAKIGSIVITVTTPYDTERLTAFGSISDSKIPFTSSATQSNVEMSVPTSGGVTTGSSRISIGTGGKHIVVSTKNDKIIKYIAIPKYQQSTYTITCSSDPTGTYSNDIWTPSSDNVTSVDLTLTVSSTVNVQEIYVGYDNASTDPTLSVAETPTTFTYDLNDGTGPSTEQTFTVTLANSSETITASLSNKTDYEMKTGEGDWGTADLTTLASGDAVQVRLKSGLSVGEHNGKLTFTSDGADNLELDLTGSVTNTVAINLAWNKTSDIVATNSVVTAPVFSNDGGLEVNTTNFNFAVSGTAGIISVDANGIVTINSSVKGEAIVTASVKASGYSADPVAYTIRVANAATKWDFTTVDGSVDKYNILAALGNGWTQNGTKDEYSNDAAFSDADGTANGKILKSLEGLRSTNAFRVDPTENAGTYGTEGRLQVDGNLTLKNMVRGQKVTIIYASANKDNARMMTTDDLDNMSGFVAVKSGGLATGVGYVKADGDIEFTIEAASGATGTVVNIAKITVEDYVPVAISAAGYATFSSTEKLNFTGIDGLTAYKATTTGENSVTLEDVTGIVPAGTGLLLKGAANTYYIPVSTADATADVDGNKLQSTATAEYTVTGEETGTAYVFGSLDDVVGFYKAAAGKTIGVGKSWLLVPGTGAKDVEFLSFVFGDEEQGETDGIKAVSTKVENGVRYNLAGQKVGADYKGIVIVNGKKYLRK